MKPENKFVGARSRTALTAIAFALPLLAALSACSGRDSASTAAAAEKPTAAALARVTVIHPIAREVHPQIDLAGTVAPSATVTLVARVQGALKEIGFTDGSNVKQGQLLFRIEPDSYRAQLAYDQSVLDNAEQNLTREKQLSTDQATSVSSLQNAEATRDQARAKRDMSRINLGYTEIRAPFAGRIGARAFDVGNVVGASADTTKLATLDRIQPVYVNFTLNERDANRIGLFTKPPRTVRVNVLGAPAAKGDDAALEFVDTRIDSGSGTISLRADVANLDSHLIPGMSVEIHIPAGPPQNVLLVPDAALLRDQTGASVYVVNAADELEKRAIVTAGLYDKLRAVTSGLEPGDRVVTSGALAVAPGAKVQAVDAQGQS
ncbi:efflux RND transporter periplasmic adaptor subunit [Trinickia sp. YCB016]